MEDETPKTLQFRNHTEAAFWRRMYRLAWQQASNSRATCAAIDADTALVQYRARTASPHRRESRRGRHND